MDSQFTKGFATEASLEFQKIVIRIIEIMEAADEKLNCAIKWGQLTYAKNADFHHWIVEIKVTKKFVGLVFHFGGLLDDPNKVFISGTSKFGRKIEYRRIEDVDKEVILDFLTQALGKYTYFKEHWKEIQDSG